MHKPGVDEVVSHFQGNLSNTTADIQAVLKYIGKPGKHTDIKREAIAKLFPGTNFQGISVVDTLESYREF